MGQAKIQFLKDAINRRKVERYHLQNLINYMQVGGQRRVAMGKFVDGLHIEHGESVDLPSRYDFDLLQSVSARLNDLYREIWKVEQQLREAQGKSTLRPVLRWSKEIDGETEVVWIGA